MKPTNSDMKYYTPFDQFRERLQELKFDSPFDNVVSISDALDAFDEAMQSYAHQQTPIAGSGGGQNDIGAILLEEAAKKYATFDDDFVQHIYDAFIAGARYAQSQPVEGWIDVEDRLPDYYKIVWVMNHYEPTKLAIAWRVSDGKNEFYTLFQSDEIWYNITHWMPLPKPPQAKPILGGIERQAGEGGDVMKKVIVINKSDVEMKYAMQMAMQSLEVEIIGSQWAFKDFSITEKEQSKGYTVRIVNNKSSKRITVYNEEITL